jgi:hypothetical protein
MVIGEDQIFGFHHFLLIAFSVFDYAWGWSFLGLLFWK